MKLFSTNAASLLLEKDRRTVTKVMQGVAPDAKVNGQARWKLRKFVDALAAHERPAAAGSNGDGGHNNFNLQRMFVQLDDLHGKIEDAKTVEKRRQMMREQFFPLLAETTAAMHEDSRRSGEDSRYGGLRISEHERVQLMTLRKACGWNAEEVMDEFNAVTWSDDDE